MWGLAGRNMGWDGMERRRKGKTSKNPFTCKQHVTPAEFVVANRFVLRDGAFSAGGKGTFSSCLILKGRKGASHQGRGRNKKSAVSL